MGGMRMAKKYNVIVSYSHEEDLVRKAAGYKTMIKIAIDIAKRAKGNKAN